MNVKNLDSTKAYSHAKQTCDKQTMQYIDALKRSVKMANETTAKAIKRIRELTKDCK